MGADDHHGVLQWQAVRETPVGYYEKATEMVARYRFYKTVLA